MHQGIAKRYGISVHFMGLLLVLSVTVHAGAPVYRVHHADGHQSYLVGTMHSEDPRVTAVAGRLVPLLAAVDTLALELVPDGITMMAVGMATLLPAGQQLREIVGEARFRELMAVVGSEQLPVEAINRLKPWAVAVLIGMPVAESGQFLDLAIYQQALSLQREVVGLETAAEQLAVFDRMSLSHQLELLDASIKDSPDLPTKNEAMVGAYLSGQLSELETLAKRQFAGLSSETAAWLEQALIVKRNRLMVERARLLLEEGPALIAVGALHLPGESGLLKGLGDAGYRLERLMD